MRIREVLFLYLLLIGAYACSPKEVLLNDLDWSHSEYYYKGAPFTGIGVSKFENGNVSNEIRFQNGVPNGEWKAYGYGGEIVQEGTYHPILFKDSAGLSGGDINRLNVCTTIEGAKEFYDGFIILEEPAKNTIDTGAIRLYVVSYLKNIPAYGAKIESNRIKFVRREF